MAGPAAAQAPDRAWRTVETAHVRVAYPAPHDSLGARAAIAAERAWQGLAARLAVPPQGRVEVVVSDDIDLANAFASVSPYPLVVVYARPPFGDVDLADLADWLDVAVAHEMTHVVHLDEARRLPRLFRAVFGRVPATGWPFFPHLTTPPWTIEGIAVRYETALTGAGRLSGTATDRVVRTAAVEDRIPDLDLATGDPVVWPAGNTRYAFGGEFLGWMAARHGEEPFARYVRALAGDPLPFRVDRASRRAFGESFSESWEAWRVDVTARHRALADSLARRAPMTRAERLTSHGYLALGPRWSPDGAQLAYATYDGRSDARLARIDAATGAEIASARVPRLGIPAWRRDGSLVLEGFRWDGPHRLRDELWVLSPAGTARPLPGRVRSSQPDVARDGRIVAVHAEGGTNRLVVVVPGGELEPIAITPLDPDVHWAWPRWSPDGARIAASRWSGGGYDIVVLDSRGRLERVVASDGAVNLSPAWSPDGAWLLFGSDRTGIANLYAFDLAGASGLRQVTNVVGGAFFPDVSPDGRAIAFAGYHHDGWAIERMGFDPPAWLDPAAVRPRHVPAEAGGSPLVAPAAPVALSAPRPYSSWPMLRPRYWVPIVGPGEEVRGRTVLGPRVGAATSAFDAVGRHGYAALATVDAEHGRSEGFLGYRNAAAGRPILDVAVSQSWDFAGFALPPDAEAGSAADTLFVLARDREVAVFAGFPFRHPYRLAHLALGAGVLEERLVLLEPDLRETTRARLEDPRRVLPQAFAQGRFSTARAFAFSVSPERGFAGSGRGEWRFDPRDEGRARREGRGRLAGYLPLGRPWGFARSVAALRASGGMVRGPGARNGHFALGGTGGGLELPELETSGAEFAVRGYERGVRRGRTTWSASAEVRFPLALIQRGRGLWPVFLDRLSGAAFLDAGDAWDPCLPAPRSCPPDLEPLVSSGAELVLQATVFYAVPLTLRLGVARALVEPVGTEVYLVVGRPF